jgi:hypothetical protein
MLWPYFLTAETFLLLLTYIETMKGNFLPFLLYFLFLQLIKSYESRITT